MQISIIVAVAQNGVIGKDNTLLWKLSADLKRFKEFTMGHHIIMGRKTFESIGKPLPGRTSVIISTNPDLKIEGCIVVNSLENAFKVAEKAGDTEACIIGGGQIYKLAMSQADKIHYTEVNLEPEGDTFFPEIDKKIWKEIARQECKADEKNESDYTFVDYERKSSDK